MPPIALSAALAVRVFPADVEESLRIVATPQRDQLVIELGYDFPEPRMRLALAGDVGMVGPHAIAQALAQRVRLLLVSVVVALASNHGDEAREQGAAPIATW